MLPVLLLLQIAWGAAFIADSSVKVGGERIFCLFDDAMISMTYARNLVDGFGLNWARHGDPVEGFTCPLWTGVMVPVNALPLRLGLRSLVVQALSLLILAFNVVLIARLAERHFSASATTLWLPAALLTAFTYSLNYWSLMGMETALQALLITVGTLLTLELLSSRGKPLSLGIVLALAALHRPDMAILGVVWIGALWWGRDRWASASSPERPWRRWTRLLLPPIVAVLLYEIFRLSYFGDPLPNTYYLKLVGTPLAVRLTRGWLVFRDLLGPMIVPVAAVLIGAAWMSRRRWSYRIGLAIVIGFAAYSVWVGGDAWEHSPVGANRFIAPILPTFYLLFNGLLASGLKQMGERRRKLQLAVGAVLTLALLTFVNGLWLHPREQARRDQFLLRGRPYSVRAHATNLRDLRYIQRLLPAEGLLAAQWAGIPAYFSDFRLADMLGYNDRHIAHMDPAVELTVERAREFSPGHLKWDYDYLLGEIRPDVVYRLWGLSPKEKRSFMRSFGYVQAKERVWVRRDSELVLRP